MYIDICVIVLQSSTLLISVSHSRRLLKIYKNISSKKKNRSGNLRTRVFLIFLTIKVRIGLDEGQINQQKLF